MARKRDRSPSADPPAVNRGGRPPHQRDERTARQVEAMAGYGIPVLQIARLVGMSETTLRKYYREEVELGAAKANAKVIESLFRKATGEGQGAVTAAIFWAKTRCGWRERDEHQHIHAHNQVVEVILSAPMTPDRWEAEYCEPGPHGPAIEAVPFRAQTAD